MTRSATVLLVLLTLCLNSYSWAQVNVSMLSLKDTTSSELYLNAENKVKITGLSDGDKVLFAEKQLPKSDSDTYVLSSAYTADSILTVKNKRGATIFSKAFQIRKFPDVIVRLDTIKGTYASIGAILANPALVIETGNFKGAFQVVAFDLAIKSGEAYEETPTMLGSRLSVYQINRIRQLKPGDKLFFENIRASCPTCAIRKLLQFTIIVQ